MIEVERMTLRRQQGSTLKTKKSPSVDKRDRNQAGAHCHELDSQGMNKWKLTTPPNTRLQEQNARNHLAPLHPPRFENAGRIGSERRIR
jgi:hypothetical protein